MPYSSLSEANIKKISGVSLTLEQVNSIARMADAIGGDKGWPIAISKFKETHKIVNGKWVMDSEKEKKFSGAYVTKQANGSYWITAVSTAAVKDREGETFTTEAIDHDIKVAKETNQYPEFRVFHSSGLGIGKVKKMSRVGIFAIDEGESYKDPFSIAVCEKMLLNNKDGKWRVSRGFGFSKASGTCPKCGEDLLIRTKHMQIGFRCPTCKSVNLGTAGSLGNMRFLEARTFDVTVTDTPAVPYTGVSAFPMLSNMEVIMNKEQLKKRLLTAGLEESEIDERLGSVTEEKLKEFDDIPDAVLLKEFQDDKETDEEDSEENIFMLDDSSLKEFAKIVKKEVDETVNKVLDAKLDGLSVEVEDEDQPTFKEMPEFVELKEKVDSMYEMLETLLKSDTERIKELAADTPRNGLRVLRTKSKKQLPPPDDEGDEETADEEDMEDAASKMKKNKNKEYSDDILIVDAEGNRAKSMTDFVLGGK
jgi:hypothetical protein